jgi:hypothetical protein
MLSKSSIELWYRCPKAWQYAYVDGYEPLYKSREMRLGLAGHAWLESYFKGSDKPDIYACFRPFDLEGADAFKLRTLLEHWTGVPSRRQLLGVEHPFELPEIGMKGVFDAVEELKENDLRCIRAWEHKFTSSDHSVDTEYWDRLRTDWQAGAYQVALRQLYPGYDRYYVHYNVFRIPQLRQLKNEDQTGYSARIEADIVSNPGRYYGQCAVSWSDESLARLENDFRETAAMMALAKAQGLYPRSRKCREFRKPCDYTPVCFKGEPLTNESLYQVRTRR